MATLPNPTPTPDAGSDPGVIWYTASVPLNCRVLLSGAGEFSIHGPERGTPLPAGERFGCPARLADEFERVYNGRIAGLTRVG
jgi:hypothetical protein